MMVIGETNPLFCALKPPSDKKRRDFAQETPFQSLPFLDAPTHGGLVKVLCNEFQRIPVKHKAGVIHFTVALRFLEQTGVDGRRKFRVGGAVFVVEGAMFQRGIGALKGVAVDVDGIGHRR